MPWSCDSVKMAEAAEVEKLRNHLSLLREEYVKLQKRLADVEKKYQVALATSGRTEEDNFISRLLKTVAELFDKELYSDLVVQLDGQSIRAHRFVLAARSDCWGVPDLAQVSQLDFTGIPYDVASALFRWVYTDQIDIASSDIFLLDLLKAASKFKLDDLSDRCEKALMSSVNVRNCIRMYQTAEEIGAEILKQHCSELISNHWNDFNSDDFVCMPAPLLYKMFKAKTEYPLHTAIRAKREDVVFLYLIEYDNQLPGKLNELDNRGDLVLDLALTAEQKSIADTLINHKVDTSARDNSGKSLLQRAIIRGDEFSASYLINAKADTNAATPMEKETALHLVASANPESSTSDAIQGMARIAKLLLEKNADVNAQDVNGSTPLHQAVANKNDAVFDVLLADSSLNLELQNSGCETVLWLALQVPVRDGGPPVAEYGEDSLAARLIKRGSSPDAINPETGDSLLHLASREENETAAMFLANQGAKVSLPNSKGETPLHTAAQRGLVNLATLLLNKGANPNAQTRASLDTAAMLAEMTLDEEERPVSLQTPLHLAIINRHEAVVAAFIEYKIGATKSGDNMKIIPNFNLKDSQGQTALGLALWNGFHQVASQLLNGGADINHKNSEGLTLFHQAVLQQDAQSAIFLLDHQADINAKTKENESCLQLAIQRHVPVVVDSLCTRGANMNYWYDNGDCPLWQALETGQEDIASTLVRHGCDTDMWGKGPDDCEQTLLHRAIDESNEAVACFLIRSMCDVNSPRRPGPNGEGGEEARDGQCPLHLAAAWGLEGIVQSLVEHNANVNAQDAEGKSPIHVAIENQHAVIIQLLMSHPGLDLSVRDKHGLTPFAAAMMTKNNKAAQAILDREPTAAEQVDNKGRNFLHVAIQKSDIESVLFLISIHANVNSRVQDSQQLTPLHLATQVGAEIIVRNLLLAGAQVNDVSPQRRTALHIAAERDHASIASVLLENRINFDALDDNMNNALHIGVLHANLATTRVLLTESRINAEAVNARGQNPLHILGQYGKENAAPIFELFRECMPEYPVDHPDAEGNSVLLLAYTNGNGNLCRAIVRAGACIGSMNKHGLSIFNAPVATKQLLFKLLDMLSKEPPWSDGETCQECAVKFGIKTRKHHCRHCGRLLCSKCSSKDMLIIKYNITKPTRVCEVCFDVLTLGAAASS